MKSLKLNALFNVIRTAMTIVFPLITFPYASRILLPEGIGKVNFANSIVSYFGMIASLGIGTYGIREAAKVRNNRLELTKVAKELFSINMISTGVAYFLFFISLFIVPQFQEYKALLCVCSATILLSTLGMNWLYSAMEDFLYIAIRSVAFQFLSLALLFIFVKTKEDYVAYASIAVISSAGANLLNFIHARKYIDFSKKMKLQIKRHIAPIFILFGTSLAASVFTTLDTSMLGFISGPVEVGFYSAGTKIVRMIRDLFPAVVAIVLPRISFYISENENERLSELSNKMFAFIFCFSIPIIVGLFILGESIIFLLCGTDFYPAIAVLQVLAPLIIVSAISGFLGGQILIAHRMDKIYLLSMILAAIVNIVMNALLIPHWGATGAALGTLIAEITIVLVDIVFLRNFLKTLHILHNLFHFLIATIIMSIPVYLLYNFLSNHLFFRLFIPIIVGIVVYGFVLIVLRNEFACYLINDVFKKALYRIFHFKSQKEN